MRYLSFLVAIICLGVTPGICAVPTLSLAPIWTDHAVIQRDQPITIAGNSTPGQRISATLGAQSATAQGDAAGRFILNFAQKPAGNQPLTLSVTAGDATIRMADLLVGDVWLCSGQSNMELPVTRALNAAGESAESKDDSLRLITIPKAVAYAPNVAFGGKVAWSLANPKTVPDFSAGCYFMGRDLRAALHVPIGLIHSSWGGSQIRAWLSPAAGRSIYGASEMALLDRFATDPLGAVTAFAPRWEQWYETAAGGSQPWRAPDSLDWHAVPQISGWLSWTGTPLATKATGTVWLRQRITLTKAEAATGAMLSLGVLDDMDMTWVNGKPVGNSFGWDYEREYKVPASYLREGINDVLVAVTNSYADGGFKSSADKLSLTLEGGARKSLAQGWQYSISQATSYPPRAPWDANAGIGVMHNHMIAPLGSFGLKGAAWYQGESDADTPGYQQRLKALISGWREQFGAKLDVLVVQLANYGAPQLGPANSGWAQVRDDQRAVVAADSNATLVSAIDLGERSDIHPANKQVLGHRLALAARRVLMPMPATATRDRSGVRVQFRGIEGGLHAWSGPRPLGFELCANDGADCRFADAVVEGDSVRLALDGRPASKVRYAWADSPIVNLYDARALPVPGFEMAITPGD